MSARDDGGAAFPSWQSVARPQRGSATAFGMTLRDYFAATVDISWYVIDDLAAPDEPGSNETDDDGRKVVPPSVLADRIAKARYMVADAMIAERNK